MCVWDLTSSSCYCSADRCRPSLHSHNPRDPNLACPRGGRHHPFADVTGLFIFHPFLLLFPFLSYPPVFFPFLFLLIPLLLYWGLTGSRMQKWKKNKNIIFIKRQSERIHALLMHFLRHTVRISVNLTQVPKYGVRSFMRGESLRWSRTPPSTLAFQDAGSETERVVCLMGDSFCCSFFQANPPPVVVNTESLDSSPYVSLSIYSCFWNLLMFKSCNQCQDWSYLA